VWACPKCQYDPPKVEGFIAHAPSLAWDIEGFEQEFFDGLATYEENNFWFTSRNKLIVAAMREFFATAESFLEVGCGTGFVLSGLENAFPGLQLSGSEILCHGWHYAQQRVARAQVFQMDALNIPFEEEFDVIGAFDVVEHIAADGTVLANFHRATKPGGGIILTVPQHAWLWSEADDRAHHVRRYSRGELVQKVTAAGFKVERVTSFVSLLLAPMVVSRLVNRKSEPDHFAEFKISPVLNRAFDWVMALERTLLRTGVSLPAGGSLLLVARKV
jgi:SAM-dependent methyltransferase